MNLCIPIAQPASDFTTIARKLGPERCASALAAFLDADPQGFEGCALARAYGSKGALQCAYHDWTYRTGLESAILGEFTRQLIARATEFMVQTFGLTPGELVAVINAFDNCSHLGARAALHAAFAAEAAKLTPVAPVAAPCA